MEAISTAMAFFTAPSQVIFSAALTLLLALVAVELVGLMGGFSLIGDFDADLEIDADVDGADVASSSLGGGIFSFLGLGRVPFLVWLIAFLCLFGIIGLLGQRVSLSLFGGPAPVWLSVPLTLFLTAPILGRFCSLVARLLPSFESAAVTASSLVGQTATITQGTARAELAAQARVYDVHNNPHYVRVKPLDGAQEFARNSTVRLVHQDADGIFKVIAG